MKIIEKKIDNENLKLKINSNEETILNLIKTYLNKESEVEVTGVIKKHHLVDETSFLLKVKKGKNPEKVLKDALKKIKIELKKLKV